MNRENGIIERLDTLALIEVLDSLNINQKETKEKQMQPHVSIE